MDVNDRHIDDEGPITNLLGLCYDEGNMNRSDIFNAVVRRDAVLTKWLLKIERDMVGDLMSRETQLLEKHDQEVAALKLKLKATTEQLRAEVARRNPYMHSTVAARLGWP